MSIPAFIALLVLLFPSSFTGKLTNEQILNAHYAYTHAEVIGIDPVDFVKLMYCESKFRTHAKGDWRSETEEYMARGVYQYWFSTYALYSKIYNVQGTYTDPKTQTNLAAKMIRDGGIGHWYNCSKTLAVR